MAQFTERTIKEHNTMNLINILAVLFALLSSSCLAAQHQGVPEGSVAEGWVYYQRVLYDKQCRKIVVIQFFDGYDVESYWNQVRDAWWAQMIQHHREKGKETKDGDFTYFFYPASKSGDRTFLDKVFYKDKSLHVYAMGESPVNGESPEIPSEELARQPSAEELKSRLRLLLRSLQGEVKLPVDIAEGKRRKAVYDKRVLDEKCKDLSYAAKVARGCSDNSVWAVLARRHNVPEARYPGERVVVPNVNEGLFTRADFRGKLESLLGRNTPGPFSCTPSWEIASRGSLLGRQGDTEFFVLYAFAGSGFQAACNMYIFGNERDASCNQIIGLWFSNLADYLESSMESAGDAVGELAVRWRESIGEDGLPVKGSQKRSVFFTRGNTAVGVFSHDPCFNALPIARAIDKLLVEGMRKAGEPLTKEQDYLKEDAEKK